MTPAIVLEIIKLSLEITLEVIKGIPIERREAMWAEHEKRMEFWRALFANLHERGDQKKQSQPDTRILHRREPRHE